METKDIRQLQMYFAERCESNRVYPMSIAEGTQDGDILFDDPADPRAALFWHYAGFAFLSGSINRDFLQPIYQNYFAAEPKRRFVLITDDDKVADFFADKVNIGMDKRVEYRFGSLLTDQPRCGYEIVRISSDNYDKLHGRIIPAFSWTGKEQYLQNGFGFAALDKDKVIAAAFSAAVSSREVDIGIETDEAYRHQGLAKALADRMCREILAMGKKPVWAHSVSNEGSGHTAIGVGFVEEKIHTVIFRK
ncbi:MAG: GNAT family N-acetyltransferase [Lachnospiraceae bacterium]|nr:GNAT family N-acetyltransferase [Lachnospiraceae bacterium]